MTASTRANLDPETVLAQHLPTDLTRTVLARTVTTVELDVVGRGRWTVHLDHGRVSVTPGAATHPTSTVRLHASTLQDLLLGEISGVDAFLSRDLVVRGSLATVLQVGGSFAPDVDLPSRPRAREVSALGARTAYLEAGPADAPPVVLLHGMGATNASMLPVLAGLARDYRVYSPDTPGFGASEAPPWTYTAEQLHRWLRSFLHEVGATEHGPVSVVGNSLGGRLALELALRDPDTVDKLVLLCAAPAFRRRRQLAPVARRVPAGIGRVPVGMPRAMVIRFIKSMFADPTRVPDTWYSSAADENAEAMGHAGHRRALVSAALNIYTDEPFGDDGFWERLRALAPPALFLWGTEDRLVPAGFARHVAEAVPSAQSMVLPHCGHVPQLELPELTVALTRSFLTPGRGRATPSTILDRYLNPPSTPPHSQEDTP